MLGNCYRHCIVHIIISLYTQTAEGEDDVKKGTQLLEVYALEIQMYTAQKNNKKLKVRLNKCLIIIVCRLYMNSLFVLNQLFPTP